MAELDADARKKIPANKFAEPDKRAYPIEDKPHARNAKARASQAVKAGRMSKAEQGRIDKKADAVIKDEDRRHPRKRRSRCPTTQHRSPQRCGR
jgi:hypothetical protein